MSCNNYIYENTLINCNIMLKPEIFEINIIKTGKKLIKFQTLRKTHTVNDETKVAEGRVMVTI